YLSPQLAVTAALPPQRSRWGLKAPARLLRFDDVVNTFPDAVFVHTHRDPARVLPSFCDLVRTARGMHSHDVDPARLGLEWQEEWAAALDSAIRIRGDRHVPVYDLYYADLVRDPVAAVR